MPQVKVNGIFFPSSSPISLFTHCTNYWQILFLMISCIHSGESQG